MHGVAGKLLRRLLRLQAILEIVAAEKDALQHRRCALGDAPGDRPRRRGRLVGADVMDDRGDHRGFHAGDALDILDVGALAGHHHVATGLQTQIVGRRALDPRLLAAAVADRLGHQAADELEALPSALRVDGGAANDLEILVRNLLPRRNPSWWSGAILIQPRVMLEVSKTNRVMVPVRP